MNDYTVIRRKLATVAKALAAAHKDRLDSLKSWERHLDRLMFNYLDEFRARL